MPLIRPASLALIDAARAGSGTVRQADAAARALRADYERWGRLGRGLLAYLGTVVGVFFGAAALSGMEPSGSTAGAPPGLTTVEFLTFGVLGSVSFAVALVCGCALCRLWHTGRQLSRAAAWWLRLPYAHAGRARRASGWFVPRSAQYEPRIFVRTVSCSLLFLVGACGISAVFMPGIPRTPHLLAALVSIGVVSLLCLCGIMGGVLRITSGLAEQDPLWGSIRRS